MGFSAINNNAGNNLSNTYLASLSTTSHKAGEKNIKVPTPVKSVKHTEASLSLASSSAPSSKSLLDKVTEMITKSAAGNRNSTQLKEAKDTLRSLAASAPELKEGMNEAINELFAPFSSNQKGRNAATDISNGITSAFSKIGLTPELAEQAIQTVLSWDRLNDSQKLGAASGIAIDVLSNLEIIDQVQSTNLSTIASTITALTQPGLSNSDRGLAIAQTLSELGTMNFTGSVDMPSIIEGRAVIGSTSLEDGSAGFLLEDGSVVPRSDLVNTSNIQSALQAVALLTSDAETEDKITGLISLGLNVGRANELISNVNAGRIGAVLDVVGLATNWDEMDDIQRFSAATQTTGSVLNALGAASSTQLGNAIPGVGAVTGLVTGVMQAKDVLDVLGDLSRKEGVKVGAIGLGSAGAAIGAGIATASAIASGATLGATLGSAVPIVGTIIGGVVGAGIGALVGMFGSSKSPGQMMRDQWRDSMETQGFAHKIGKSHHVTLANGTEYNIGKDGGAKLPNVDGTERRTYDVDWSNQIAGQSIPMAHLFGIATGLDPSATKSDLWSTTVGQSLNAATSNATTLDDVSNNFRAMLSAGNVAPENLAIRIEVLRLTNKITDQEYTVYLDSMNKLLGTELQPNDREVAHRAIVEQLTSQPELSEGDQFLLQSLTDESVYADSIKVLEERIGRDVANIEAPPKK